MVVGIAINSIEEDMVDCLTTRGDGGIFRWGEGIMKKLQSMAGAESLRAKQIDYVLCMFEYTYLLMMSPTDRMKIVPFKPFMGRSLNLQKSREHSGDGGN